MLKVFCKNMRCQQEYTIANSSFQAKCGACGSTDVEVKVDLTCLKPDIKVVVTNILRAEGSWVVQ